MRELIRSVEVGRASPWTRWWSKMRRRRRASRVTIISLESNLVAVDTLSSIQIDVILVSLSCLALPELRLSVIRDRAVASYLESIVWILVVVALEDMCRCCLTFIRQHADHNSKTYLVTRAYTYKHMHMRVSQIRSRKEETQKDKTYESTNSHGPCYPRADLPAG